MLLQYRSMMNNLALLCIFGISAVTCYTVEEDFEYLERRFNGEEWVTTEVPELTEGPDDWPDGSYTLLMSKHGCPAGKWNMGYLSFTWKTSHIMLSHDDEEQCNDYINLHRNNTECRRLVSEESWPNSPSNLYGPYHPYKMMLNFCQRSNTSESKVTSHSWPQVPFRLFDANATCPEGFYNHSLVLTLPSTRKWTSNGYLPSYEIVANGSYNTVLTLGVCVRILSHEENSTSSDLNGNFSTTVDDSHHSADDLSREYFKTIKSAFILLKDGDTPCLNFSAYKITTEIISLADENNAKENVTILFQFCFYHLEYVPEKYNKDFDEYELPTFKMRYIGTGDHNADQDSDGDRVHAYEMYCTEGTLCWTVIDIGRTLPVSGVMLYGAVPYTAHISNDKWSLIKFSGIEVFKKQYVAFGRYVLLTIPHYSSKTTLFTVKVSVKSPQYHMCMVDLGIVDGSITRKQISVSHQYEYVSTVFGLNRTSWCIKDIDKNFIPYIQVDLQHDVPLDGITICNWYKTVETMTDGVYMKSTLLMGMKSFIVSFSTDRHDYEVYNNLTFNLDLFRRADEPQTFIFLKQVKARYIKIHLLEPMTPGNLCLSFELHGCRHKGLIDNPVILSSNTDEDLVIGAVQKLTLPEMITNVGYPESYREGTSYSWIIDFRNIGYIKLIFNEILLQAYQYRSHSASLYFCEDKLQVLDLMKTFWTLPSPSELTNVILATQEKYLVIEFNACKPYYQKTQSSGQFSISVSVTDLPTCSFTDQKITHQKCSLSTMLLSSMSMKNIPRAESKESWQIKVFRHVINVTFTYFHVHCDALIMKFEVKNRYSDVISYSNCEPPPSVIISESDIITLTLDIRETTDSLSEFGFTAVYTTSKEINNNLIDTYDKYYGYEKIRFDYDNSETISNGTTFLVFKACSASLKECYSIFSGNPMSWTVASEDCWIRRKRLVSIKSKEKLEVIYYILRFFLNVLVEYGTIPSPFYSDNVDPSYFCHIGLMRKMNKHGIREFVWIDGSPVQYYAWNKNQPKQDGDCVRTSFYFANKKNAWEVEDCVKQLSLFYMCEEPLEAEGEWNPSMYTGYLSTTITGQACQRWDSRHFVEDDSQFPDENITDAANFCRDPSNNRHGEEKTLWCYSTDPEKTWEYCKLKETVSDRCYRTHSIYSGTLNVTYSGIACQHWDASYPHTPDQFNKGNMSRFENYCLDPMNDGFLWCYTMDPNVIRESCVNEIVKASNHSFVEIEDSFACDNGRRISFRNVCNGIVDCIDALDEMDCDYREHNLSQPFDKEFIQSRLTPTHTRFECNNNEIISMIAICDDVIDCIDGSDETHCDRDTPGCSVNEFMCGDGRCISVSLVCDFIPHCNDHSDEFCEYPKCKDFKCENGQCILLKEKCNGYKDCLDGSDEKSCDTCQSSDAFHCDTRCIPKRLVCDGFYDCNDEQDEMACSKTDHLKCEEKWMNGLDRKGRYKIREKSTHPSSSITTLLTTTSNPQCRLRKTDLIFILDSSTSVSIWGFSHIRKFLTDFLRNADIDSGSVRVGIVIFSTDVHVVFHLNAYSSEKDVYNAINELSRHYGSTHTADALRTVSQVMFTLANGDRADASNIAVLITDGLSYDPARTISEAEQARNMNIRIYVVGINLTVTAEVESIASKPIDKYLYSIKSFDDLEGLEKKIFSNNCQEWALAECIYDDVNELNTISTVFNAVEIPEDNMDVNIFIPDTSRNFLNEWLYEYDCSQTFTQTCKFAVQEVFVTENGSLKNVDQHCQCVALTLSKPYQAELGRVHACNDTTHQLNNTLIHVTYEWNNRWPVLKRKDSYNDNYNIHIGPLVCKKEVVEERQWLPCGDTGATYHISRRCMYDIDSEGRLLGCRYGDHLNDCNNFSCPTGSLKCPESYCIPLDFLCNGINNCPGGDDEVGCGCNNDDLEVIFLLSAEEFHQHYTQLKRIAHPFNTRGSIVRFLYYRTSIIDELPFDHQILHITDTEIDEKDLISFEHECKYRILASEFVSRVQFTKESTRGIIFFQNDTKSTITARKIFQNILTTDYDIYRIVLSSPNAVNDVGFTHVTDIKVRSLNLVESMANRLFPHLCKETFTAVCPGYYRCSSSSMCIEHRKLCDGHAHCPFSDDEMFCDYECPTNCSCIGYSVDCSETSFKNISDIDLFDKNLRVLDMHSNPDVGFLFNEFDNFVLAFPFLIVLNISNCNIKTLSSRQFSLMPNLRSLNLSHNKIISVPDRAFFGLRKLVHLNLLDNKGYITFESNAFIGLVSLKELVIIASNISLISEDAFHGLNLDKLEISDNYIKDVIGNAFSGLSVRSFTFESNELITYDKDIFKGIMKLESLQTSAYKYCCLRPDYLPENNCLPEKDEFSSCDALMRNATLRVMLWIMGICALLGNILAIVYRIVYDRERLKLGYGIFVTNLAVSDLFMGVYLLIIAIADASYRDRYIYKDEYWRNSLWCTFAGVLSTLSSEASVLFICLITLDRVIVIKSPFSGLRFSPRKAIAAATLAWVVASAISLTPLLVVDYFKNVFYSKSGVCVALPLTRDRPPGWLYSVIVFIGVNFVIFILIAIGQLSIYLEIKKVSSKVSQKRSGKSKASRRKELVIARNLLLVVATDFLCWFPVGCMGVMAMNGHVIPGEVYAWTAVFILPVNSALNPIIYTLTTIRSQTKQTETTDNNSAQNTFRRFKYRDMEKLAPYFVPKLKDNALTMISLESLIQQNEAMSLDAILIMTTKITKCLNFLHNQSVVIENLGADCLFVSKENGKINGDVFVGQKVMLEPSSESKKQENIYMLGVLIRRFILCYTKSI